MIKEVDLQAQLIAGVKEAGGWGKKLTNTYTSGIPDLLISVPWHTVRNSNPSPPLLPTPVHAGLYVVEIKTVDSFPVRPGDPVRFKHPLTELQNQCLLSMRAAGGRAGWWAIRRLKSHDEIFVGLDKTGVPTRAQWEECRLIRKRGQKWGEILWPLLRPLMNSGF